MKKTLGHKKQPYISIYIVGGVKSSQCHQQGNDQFLNFPKLSVGLCIKYERRITVLTTFGGKRDKL